MVGTTPLAHVDDSPDVLRELKQFCENNPELNWGVFGISVPGKPKAEGARYFSNIKGVVDTICSSPKYRHLAT